MKRLKLGCCMGAIVAATVLASSASAQTDDTRHHDSDEQTIYRLGMIAALQRCELLRVVGQLSDELGLAFTEAKPGERIEGTLVRAVDLAGGKQALIERSRDFTLVLWRPVLEPRVGQSVSGIMREGGISWSFGRQRSGPGIS